MTTDPRLVDTVAAAHAARVRPATIRQWARRGKLTRQGTDPHGRALYSLDAVYRTARDSTPGRPPSTTRGQPSTNLSH